MCALSNQGGAIDQTNTLCAVTETYVGALNCCDILRGTCVYVYLGVVTEQKLKMRKYLT